MSPLFSAWVCRILKISSCLRRPAAPGMFMSLATWLSFTMLMSFNSTRSSVGVPLLAAWADPCLRRCAPRWVSGPGGRTGGSTAGGGTVAGGARGGVTGLASAAGLGSTGLGSAGLGSAGLASTGLSTALASTGLASTGLISGGAATAADLGARSGRCDFSAAGFSTAGLSTVSGGALSRVGVFSEELRKYLEGLNDDDLGKYKM